MAGRTIIFNGKIGEYCPSIKFFDAPLSKTEQDIEIQYKKWVKDIESTSIFLYHSHSRIKMRKSRNTDHEPSYSHQTFNLWLKQKNWLK